MSDFDTLLDSINSNKRNPTKGELHEFVKNALKEIKEIDQFYRKLNEGAGDKPAIIHEIEEKYSAIQKKYDSLFKQNEQGVIESEALEKKINEIKAYHKELLEGNESIKTDINDSQEHITEFYNFLFGSKAGQNNEKKTKDAISHITSFYDKLTATDKGLENEIERACETIVKKHAELFESKAGKSSKIDELEENIVKVKKFEEEIEKKVKPNIKEQQRYLDDLKGEIDKKTKDVNDLVKNATGGALANGYRESMETYSQPATKSYEKAFKERRRFLKVVKVIAIFIQNNFTRHIGFAIGYLIFFLPLIAISILFLEPEFTKSFIKHEYNGIQFTGNEYLFFKTFISLPLLWIAWFGQKTISSKRRLFEEYNHKLRVVQMYIMLTENKNTYTLAQKKELEGTLLGAIKSNPAEHLGKGETMIDSILEKFYIGGFYKKLKKEIVSELKPEVSKES